MREGKSITELAQELTRIRETSKDLIVPTSQMEMTNGLYLQLADDYNSLYKPTDWAMSQISTYTDIPKAYFERITQENSSLLASSVNHGFQAAINRATAKKKTTSRMLRTVDGNVRGFLSSRYRRMDSYDLLEVVLPILQENDFQIRSSNLSDKKMYLKSITHKLEGEVKPGFPVRYGLSVSTSDYGCGSLQISPFIEELICKNGCTMEQAIRKFHLGKDQGSDSIDELLTDETKMEMDKAFWMQVRDIINGTMELEVFNRQLGKLQEAAGQDIKSTKIEKVVELAMKEVGATGDAIKDSIVAQLANGSEGRGFNKWGLANCFTRASYEIEDATYEEASDLERAGGKIIELSGHVWEKVANAA